MIVYCDTSALVKLYIAEHDSDVVRTQVDAAAEALGLSRRMVAYYYSGERNVPKTVLLACRGWEAYHDAA